MEAIWDGGGWEHEEGIKGMQRGKLCQTISSSLPLLISLYLRPRSPAPDFQACRLSQTFFCAGVSLTAHPSQFQPIQTLCSNPEKRLWQV